MSVSFASPPRIEYGQFRTRSADADWDFFPFGRSGHGYRVNEARRAKLRRFSMWVAKPAEFLICILIVVAIAARSVDYKDALQFGLLVGAAITPFILHMIGEWLYVRRLPPAERPLTLDEIRGFLALTQPRGETLARLVLGLIGAVAFGAGTLLEAMRGAEWIRVTGPAWCALMCSYFAWQAYCVRRLQMRLTPPAASSISEKSR